jgi:hypothetical protein
MIDKVVNEGNDDFSIIRTKNYYQNLLLHSDFTIVNEYSSNASHKVFLAIPQMDEETQKLSVIKLYKG